MICYVRVSYVTKQALQINGRWNGFPVSSNWVTGNYKKLIILGPYFIPYLKINSNGIKEISAILKNLTEGTVFPRYQSVLQHDSNENRWCWQGKRETIGELGERPERKPDEKSGV